MCSGQGMCPHKANIASPHVEGALTGTGCSLSKDNHGTLGDTVGKAWEAAQGQGGGGPCGTLSGSSRRRCEIAVFDTSISLMGPRQKIRRHIFKRDFIKSVDHLIT